MENTEEAKIPEGQFLCPRRQEQGNLPGSPFWRGKYDSWGNDNSCAYCGSLNPEEFMRRAESGDFEIGPTDKGYKVYLEVRAGVPLKQTYRECPRDAKCTGPDDCTHWVTREMTHGKFYFQHLSDEQKKRFIELLNEKKLKIGVPGHFYTLPFFMGIKGYDFKAKKAPTPVVYCLRGEEGNPPPAAQ